MLVARGDAGGVRQFLKILAHMPGSDLRQLARAVFLDPGHEQLYGVQVGAAGMLVADAAKKELLSGKYGISAGTLDNAGQVIRYQ
jgi:hypothetical protein